MTNKKHIPQGYKDSSLGIIPEDWEVEKVGTVFSQLGNFSFSREQMTYEPQQFRYIHYGDIHVNTEQDSVDLTTHTLPYIFDGLISDEKLNGDKFPYLKNGDIILADASEDYDGVGKTWEIINTDNQNIVSGLHTIALRCNTTQVAIGFGRYILKNPRSAIALKKSAQGTKVYSISYNNISKLEILLPTVTEQIKIAEILSCWDVAIEKQARLIERLEARKRGLMQQLLTGEGKGWEEVKLGDLFERVTRRNSERNTNVVTISAQRGFIKQTEFFTKSIASELTDNYLLVMEGEFCYNKSYSNGYPWGAIKRLNEFEKAVVTTLYICFKIKENNKASGDFFEQFFEANRLNKGLTKIAHEGGRAHGLLNVTPSDFFSLRILIPNLSEQEIIANILKTADKELILLKTEVERIKEQKNGLMQKLLTGETRVIV